MSYSLVSDAVLIAHAAFVVFVVVMVPLILIGGARAWRWVRILWLRVVHLIGFGVVVVQSWLGIVCPLTTLEMWLRRQGGQASYAGSFIEHWLQRLLYWNAPAWVFVTIYTVFAILVIAIWLLVPPTQMTPSDTTSGE
jgi:hypothetical protein